MPGIIWRVIIAVLAVVFAVLIIPPLVEILGLPMPANVWLVLRLCIAALAVFYIIRGWKPPPA